MSEYRATITDAYYGARNAGQTMEYAATIAAAGVEAIAAAAIAAERERVLAEFEALADDLTPPYNCDLNDDGSADREMAAWVEGRHESITDLRALVARLRGQA